MMKRLGFLIGILLIIGIVNVVSSQSFNVCCERTTSGAWCQNTDENSCDGNYRISPTSCDQTSYCRTGCCVDPDEGLCMENTPQRVCEESSGSWLDDSECRVNQCSLGCCILGDQASFVTQTRCKKLSGSLGLETNFLNNVLDEASCILIANSQDKGACVVEFEGRRDCEFKTRGECSDIDGSEFFKDNLCSADELNTICGPTEETTCIAGKEEVYFKDSCGNAANIYDANRVYSRDPSYWQKLVGKEESCDDGNGNVGSDICGNCEYFKGSICGDGKAVIGDFECRDLNCYDTDNGRDYKNGESWCVNDDNAGNGKDLVGSRHFRHICINGEEIVEACADFREEFCLEGEVNTVEGIFTEAACLTNRWTDCVDIGNKEDCENFDKRDCYWNPNIVKKNEGDYKGYDEGGGACVPYVPPGLNFWEDGNADTICSLGSTFCKVTIQKLVVTNKEENEQCQDASWVSAINANACVAMGDCGAYRNIAGKSTEYGLEVVRK